MKSDLQKRILFVIFNVISSIIRKFEKSSDGMTTSGFEKLDKDPIIQYQIIWKRRNEKRQRLTTFLSL
jgi:hypothetical protein